MFMKQHTEVMIMFGATSAGYVDMLRAKNEGIDNVASRSSAIIGQTSFRQWAEDHLRPVVLG